MQEEETIDGINRMFDDWVEIQLDDNSLSPAKVIELLISEKSLDANEASYIVDRIDRVIRKRNAVKEVVIGSIFLPIVPLSILFPFILFYPIAAIITIPFGLFGIFKTAKGIYTLTKISREIA